MKLRFVPPYNWRKTFIWRLLFGPALIVDGVVYMLSLGMFSSSLSLEVTRRWAKARITQSIKEK